MGSAREITLLSVKLGATAFGGPAAHISLLHDEVVERRGWLDNEEFVKLLGVTNLLPGPNSTEMVMHVGYVQAGFRGLIGAGIGFITPAALITLGLAVIYERYGTTLAEQHFLIGVQAAVVAVLLQAVWRLRRTTVQSSFEALAVVVVAAIALLGVSELVVLFAAGAVIGMIRIAQRTGRSGMFGSIGPMMLVLPPLAASAVVVPYSHQRLVLSFLKIGGLLYGSGYVLVSLLQQTFVQQLGWLTESQVVDAVAAGQMTPGPLFSSATFIGYLGGGGSGALLATVAIFLPAFVFVGFAGRLLGVVDRHPAALDLLRGVSLASIGLILAVTIELGLDLRGSWLSIGIALMGALLLFRTRLNAALIIFGGGILAVVLSRI